MLHQIRETFRLNVLPGYGARGRATQGAKVNADCSSAYEGRENHEYVKYSVGECVRGPAHTNRVESFSAVLNRVLHGVSHLLSPKHVQHYVSQFACKHNLRDLDTIDQMGHVTSAVLGKRLVWRNLVLDYGQSPAAG